jgi:hypothetical protein
LLGGRSRKILTQEEIRGVDIIKRSCAGHKGHGFLREIVPSSIIRKEIKSLYSVDHRISYQFLDILQKWKF